jgi:acetolactate synthase-1/2/3 large subunit
VSKVIENGDLILNYLDRLGIEFVFGVPGGSIEPFYNALARSERKGGPKAILARHEAGAAFMADGYARATGKIGVCCSTSGPGATNLITGVASAYADSIPLLVITAQPAIEKFGLGAFQEGSCTGINTVSMFESCTRYNTLVSHPAQLENKLLQAISFTKSNRSGPAHLSIPLDIMRAKVEPRYGVQHLRAFINHDVVTSEQGLNLLLKYLSDAKKVTFVVGEGCACAVNQLLELVELQNWLMVTTPMAKGLISDFHPLYRGVFGLGGHESAREALLPDNADYVVVVGTALDEVTTGGWDTEAVLSNRMIHISQNSEHLSRSVLAKACILGSPKLLLEQLFNQIPKSEKRHQIEYLSGTDGFPMHVKYHDKDVCFQNTSPVKPQALYWTLSQICPSNTYVLMDTGNSFLWGIHYWQTHNKSGDEDNLFHIGMGFASMGWAIGASIGMALGDKAPVICFTGDGSVLMSGQEMTVAKEHNLNILFVILNDSHLGMIKHGQQLGGAENVGNVLPKVDFAAMARAMGLQGHTINKITDLDAIGIDDIFKQEGPCVLDVIIDANEIPPMGSRMKVLAGGGGPAEGGLS